MLIDNNSKRGKPSHNRIEEIFNELNLEYVEVTADLTLRLAGGGITEVSHPVYGENDLDELAIKIRNQTREEFSVEELAEKARDEEWFVQKGYLFEGHNNKYTYSEKEFRVGHDRLSDRDFIRFSSRLDPSQMDKILDKLEKEI